MSDKIFGVIKRAYYLFIGVIAVPMTAVGIVGAIQYKGASDVVGWLVFGILAFPVARLLHMAAHWVVWGKLK